METKNINSVQKSEKKMETIDCFIFRVLQRVTDYARENSSTVSKGYNTRRGQQYLGNRRLSR